MSPRYPPEAGGCRCCDRGVKHEIHNNPLSRCTCVPGGRCVLEVPGMIRARVLAECDHCYHKTGILQSSIPPGAEEVCCYCERRRYVYPQPLRKGSHGPYAPRGDPA